MAKTVQPKPTLSRLKKMVEEFLSLKAAADRYAELKGQIKADMIALKWDEVDTPDQGRVFISRSERVEYPVKLAQEVLGTQEAEKVIQTERFVSNEILAAFIKVGAISESNVARLEAGAVRTPVISLNVRPLK